MNLVIDIGNSQYKICVFNNSSLIWNGCFPNLNTEIFSQIFTKYKIKKAIYSDTRGIDRTQIENNLPLKIQLLELTHQTKLPIKIDYNTPETLGKDRIAGAVAAYQAFTNSPVLIIDIGTAITIDFLSANAEFKGGIISPGPETRFLSLHHFTGKLPHVKPANKTNLFGTSTTQAIQFGVQNGILFEINEYILRYKQQYQNLKVITTGGYAYLFDKKINYPIFADSFLIPKGLNSILNYNE